MLRSNVLAMILLFMIRSSPTKSQTPYSNGTEQDNGQLNNHTVSPKTTTASLLTNRTKTNSATSITTLITTTTKDKTKTLSSASPLHVESTLKVQVTQKPTGNQHADRKKRKKKIKEGFQEEMATICLHDELASEALYSSWKPFMGTSDSSNRMKLVIGSPNADTNTSQTNSRALELI
ncbi:PREDICTED: uncharacterized protein LOC107336525 isoform X2 [Acropora digitifera]|uniref:uncharacterized protein LOC107336525 isoform X2 n=1 Tax=Acropora digitifera TaxID=70779 RepID=UPI00077B03D6|nr:PREDICTED: uncharacterized protein LOC107336525 isoform X2 [Acropora digitifera]